MLRQMMVIGVATFALLAGPVAHARKDGGGVSQQHMSQQGLGNANSPLVGQEKGMDRAMERKSAEGLDHGRSGQRDPLGNAWGHDKDKAVGKARGHGKY